MFAVLISPVTACPISAASLVAIACLLANNPYDGDEVYKSISQAGGLAICRILMARYGKKQ